MEIQLHVAQSNVLYFFDVATLWVALLCNKHIHIKSWSMCPHYTIPFGCLKVYIQCGYIQQTEDDIEVFEGFYLRNVGGFTYVM